MLNSKLFCTFVGKLPKNYGRIYRIGAKIQAYLV